MSGTGIEIAIATRVLSPIIGSLYASAKGSLEKEFSKWKSTAFPRKLAKHIAALEKVKTIWQVEKEVPLTNFYYPSRLDLDNQRRGIAVQTLNDLERSNVVIEGIVGQGKSILLRYLAVKELSQEGSGRIPIFFELRSIQPGKSLQHYILNTLNKYDLPSDESVFQHLANSGKLVLLLDGFDEIESKLVKDVIFELEELAERYENLQIIITSRPDNEIQKSRHFRVIKIAPLTSNDHQPFLKAIGLTTVKSSDLVHAIASSPSKISELITTPLMLTLVVLVYKAEKEIPSDLPQFFERLFQTVFTRHDKEKPAFVREHHSKLSEKALQSLFEAFCFMALQTGCSRTLTDEQFNTCFVLASKYCPESRCEVEKFRLDVTKVACLMLDEGLGMTTFLHKSIMEYYAASFIKHCQTPAAEKFYASVRHKFWEWKDVLRFLSQIDEYRYAKFYVIPSHTTQLEELSSLKKFAADDVIFGYLTRRFKNTKTTFKRMDGVFKLVSIMNLRADGNGSISENLLVDYFANGLIDSVPQSLTSLEDFGIPVQPFKKEEIEYDFHWSVIPSAYGKDVITGEVKRWIELLYAELKRYELLVAQENQKELIFG